MDESGVMRNYNHEFKKDTHDLRIAMERMLYDWFGDKCTIVESDCPLCQRWIALDVVFNDPWDEGEER